MIMIKLSFFSVFLSLMVGGGGLVQAEQTAEVKVADKAQAFELMNSEGKKVSLKDYEGKKMVVLVFSRGHW